MRSHGLIAFLVGLVLIIAGIIWGSYVAGVPYPDSSTAQQAEYHKHVMIAERLLLVGGLISFVLAPVLRVIRRWRQRKNDIR
ncbi:MAG: hypothetical protein RQ732_10335 [Methylophaga sp.]|nr:hypothetical protein [Methylophaga sp.]